VHDISIYQNESIAYRKGITVEDDCDDEPTLDIDTSAVNPLVPGKYLVIYTATDKAGNQTSSTAKVTVGKVKASNVDPLIESIINTIIKPEMTQQEKAKTIRAYVADNISYMQKGIHDDLYLAAYTGLKTGAGDCYTFYAISELLLTRAGIVNLPITRVAGARTKHYWSLIRFDGDYEWYHYDSAVHNSSYTDYMPRVNWYAFTELEAQAYTEAYDKIYKTNHQYYVYEEGKYPEIAWGY
jgi:hypothetical protein